MKSNLLKIGEDYGGCWAGYKRAMERGKDMRKDFHTKEVCFRRGALDGKRGLSSGRANLRATRL